MSKDMLKLVKYTDLCSSLGTDDRSMLHTSMRVTVSGEKFHFQKSESLRQNLKRAREAE